MTSNMPGKHYQDRMHSLMSLLDETEQDIMNDPLRNLTLANTSGRQPLESSIPTDSSQKSKSVNSKSFSLADAETIRSTETASDTNDKDTHTIVPDFASRGVLLNPNRALVEKQSPLTLQSAFTASAPTSTTQTSSTPDTTSQAGAVFSSIKEKMREQRQQLEQRGREVAQLEEQLRSANQRAAEQAAQSQQEFEQKLSAQKQSYEAVAARQMAFIESLLKEKGELTDAAARLSGKIDELTTQFQRREEALQTQFKEEVRRLREQWSAAEKAKRDKWVAEQSARIKEMTVKGLEPELQRILEKSKAEVAAERERCAQVGIIP